MIVFHEHESSSMHYLKLPHMDDKVSYFDICQAHAQLESDYNVGGIVRERPSNTRRNASTAVQLHRMKYSDTHRWVDIVPKDKSVLENEDSGDNDVRDIYLINVLKWNLPMDTEMRSFVAERYTTDFLNGFESWMSQASAAKGKIGGSGASLEPPTGPDRPKKSFRPRS